MYGIGLVGPHWYSIRAWDTRPMPVIGKGQPSTTELALQAQLEQLKNQLATAVAQPAMTAALRVPAYAVAYLPDATKWPNAIVRITDNPQGTATSNGVTWISDVDGTDLGGGNGG